MRNKRRVIFLLSIIFTFSALAQEVDLVPDSARLEAFRKYMNELQSAKRGNDTNAILSAHARLSRFYSLSGISEKAKFYKRAQLSLLEKRRPIDSAAIYLAKNNLQGIFFANDEEIDKKEVYRILRYAILTKNDELKDECHSLYRSYLMQNDLFEELSDFYEKDFPNELAIIQRDDYDNYLRIKASLFEFHGQIDSALLYIRKVEPLILENPNSYFVAKFYIRFGEFFERQKDSKRAIEKYLISMEYSEKNGYRPFLLEASTRLEALYYENGDFEKAYKYASRNMILKEEINLMANRGELLKLEIIKEKELNQLEVEKTEMATRAILDKEKTTKWIFIISGIALLLLVFGLWSRMRYIGKVNHLLKSAKNKAEQGERTKQQFLSNMSHEIRTPMNAILGMSNLMLETKIDDKQKKYLQVIKKSCENLLSIINDVLDLSKLEAGKMELEKIPFNIEDQVQIIHDTLRFKAEEKGLSCEINVSEKLPFMVLGDPNRLNQILINLCGNAIKFTEKGALTLFVESAGDIPGNIRFRVKDTGIGISEEMIANIFSSFQQADLSTSRKYGGTGLGLSISKTLVELQGGSIEVKSTEGEGSEFSFVIPYEVYQVEKESEESTEKIDYKKLLKGIKILIAEDNEFNQIVINDTLLKLIEDVSIDIAANGKIAVDKLRENDYDVVLMDVNMPEMDGNEATRAIRALDNDKKDIPIVALTANVLKKEVEKCLEAGMDAFVPKPFNSEELMEVLSKLVNKKVS